MPQNTITYTQSQIGFAIAVSGSNCYGPSCPRFSNSNRLVRAQPPIGQTHQITLTKQNSFRPIVPPASTVHTQIIRPNPKNYIQSPTRIPGRAYRVHTEATYTPESYSRSAQIRTNTIQQGMTYTYAHSHTLEHTKIASTDHPLQTGSSTETATEGDESPTSCADTAAAVDASAANTSTNEPTLKTERKKGQRRVNKAKIKRLNKSMQSGEVRAVVHWTRAVRTWTSEVEKELHAINEGTRIIESLVSTLSLE